MELNNQEKQFIVNALDAFVRQTGLQSAALALTVTAKLQESMKGEVNGKEEANDQEGQAA